MSLRARLALLVGLLLTIIMLIVGIIVVEATRSTLQDQVDEQVLETAARIRPAYQGLLPGEEESGVATEDTGSARPAQGTPTPSAPPTYRATGWFVYGPDGQLLIDRPLGFSDAPRSAPHLPPIPSEEAFDLLGEIVTVPSVDGSLNYRVYIQRDDADNFVVTAAPLGDAEEAINRLIGTLALSGLTGAVVAGLACWAMISREFRPIDRMIDTASGSGEGELGQRVPGMSEGTELRRLARAINLMLGRIQAASEAQTRSEMRLRQFVTDAAHELSTPLTSVRGYAELYRQGALGSPERVRQAMRRIEGEGTRMGALLDEMLLLARLGEQIELIHEPVDFSAVVHDAVDSFRAIQPDRQVELSLADDLVVDGVALHLRRVVDDLLTNVRMHTPADALAIVSLMQTDGMAELRVQDHGPGITPEFAPRIFEWFTRADPARTRSTGGSGLGLGVVAAIIEAHGGTIRVESAPGSGATFIARLPIIATEESLDADTGV